MFDCLGFQSPKSLDGTFENQVEEDPVVVLPVSQVRISAYDNNNNSSSKKEADSSEKVNKNIHARKKFSNVFWRLFYLLVLTSGIE